MSDIPKAGDRFTQEHLELIFEAIKKRQKNFPDEPAVMSMSLVMQNIGDRYSEVTCTEGEWSSVKAAVIPTDGPPLCPNGHEVVILNTVCLGWVAI